MSNINLELEIEKAKQYIINNNIDSAIMLLKYLKQNCGNNFDILFELGKAYLIAADNVKAISNLTSALKIKSNEYVNLLLAKSFKNNKEYRQTIKILFKLKRLGSKLEDIDKDIIRILIDKRKYILAKRYVDKYIDIEKNIKWIKKDLIDIAVNLRNIKKYKDSISILFKLKRAEKSEEIEDEIIKILIEKKKFGLLKKYINKYNNQKYSYFFQNDMDFSIEYTKIQLLELEKIFFDLLFDINSLHKILIEINLFKLYCLSTDIFINKKNFINYISDKLNTCEDKLKKTYNLMINTIEINDKNICLKSYPTELVIGLTNKCNAKCKFCISHNIPWEISNEIYNEILYLIPYLCNVSWVGGEVFLYKNFKNLFDLAKKNDVRQEIVTNAMLLDKKWMDELVTSNVKLAISIRSMEKKKYENLTGGAKFEKLIENLEYIKSISYKKHYKFELAMYTLVTKYNYMELENLIDFARKYDFDIVRFIQLDNSEKPKNDENICAGNSKYYQNLKNILNKAIEKADKYNIEVKCELPIEHVNFIKKQQQNNKKSMENKIIDSLFDDIKYKILRKKLFCEFPWTSLMLNVGGTYHFNCWCLDNSQFSVSNYSLLEFWNSDVTQEFRKKIINNDYYDICGSICTKYTVFKNK